MKNKINFFQIVNTDTNKLATVSAMFVFDVMRNGKDGKNNYVE